MNPISAVQGALSRIRLFSMKDMVWQYVANFGVAVFGATYILLVGRLLGPQEFGVYAIAAAVPSVVNAIFDYRIQEVSIVVLQEKNKDDIQSQNVKMLYIFDVMARTISFVIAIIFGILVLRIFGMSTDLRLPLFAALTVFLAKAGNGMALGVLRLSGNIQSYAILQSLDWAMRLGMLGAVYYFGSIDLISAFYAQIPSAILFNIVIILFSMKACRRIFPFQNSAHISFSKFVKFCKIRKNILLSSQLISSVDSVVKELDTIICGAFLQPQGVAVYKMAKSIASIAWKFVDPIFVIILPSISGYFADGKIEELSRILKKSTLYLFAVSFVIFLASWAMSFPFTYLVLGSGYDQVPLVYPLISVWIVLALPFIWTHSVAIASGNAPVQALAGTIGNLIGLVAIVIGAAVAGVYGAAFGLSVAYAAPFVISFILLIKKKIVKW